MLRKIAIVLATLILGVAAWEWATFPDVALLAREAPRTTAFMELRKAELRAEGKDDSLLYHWVPYERISPYLRRGVLIAEDDNFYEHAEVDTDEIKRALQKDWQKRKLLRGGSTITQQLAKNLYLSPSRNPFRKLKELLIAHALERHLTKKRILELYLNVVEMGERVYGADAAAHFYFDRPAATLTPQQAALLAGCLPNPRIMNPASPKRRLRFRQQMVLSRMRRWGYLMERDVLQNRNPEVPPPPAVSEPATEPETPAQEPAQGATSTTGAPAAGVPPTTGSSPTATTEPAPGPAGGATGTTATAADSAAPQSPP